MIRRKSAFQNLEEISATSETPAVDPAFVPKVLYGHKTSLEKLEDVELRKETRVLVLYTGGTIGMVTNEKGKLVPIPHALETRIRLYPHMHDSIYAASHFSGIPNLPLVLPYCKEKMRIAYWVYEYNPLLDSSNMTMDDWIRIACDIKKVYDDFDGFVILHGTDTLAYTASALSFMMENLGKPIVITGSQIPLFETRSDGRDNFIGSLILAGNYSVPEVTVYFNSKLYRGNRTVKISAGSLEAFSSPNMPPLAVAAISIHIERRLIFFSRTLAKFDVHEKLGRDVALLRIFPSISTTTVRTFLQPPTTGAVLQTYGAGNIPSHSKDLTNVIKDATARGVIIVNITQCSNGSVQAIYETSESLREAGVIPGSDMTPEAALTKLSYVLSKTEWDHETKRKMMKKNIRGELTEIAEDEPDQATLGILDIVTNALQLASPTEVEQIKEILIPTLFFASVSNCDVARLNSLWPHLPNINCKDVSGWSALHVAASDDSVEIVVWLLERGASVHTKDLAGHTPLWNAVLNGNSKIISLLVQTGAHLSLPNNILADTLISAAASSNIIRLKALHTAECDMNLSDLLGKTALHAACTVGSVICVQFLLSCNVNKQMKDKTGLTPLSIAEYMDHSYMCDLLADNLTITASSKRRERRTKSECSPLPIIITEPTVS